MLTINVTDLRTVGVSPLLALAALSAPIAQDETETFCIEIGEVVGPPDNFSWAPSSTTTRGIVKLVDNKTISSASIRLDGSASSDLNARIDSYLQGANPCRVSIDY